MVKDKVIITWTNLCGVLETEKNVFVLGRPYPCEYVEKWPFVRIKMLLESKYFWTIKFEAVDENNDLPKKGPWSSRTIEEAAQTMNNPEEFIK